MKTNSNLNKILGIFICLIILVVGLPAAAFASTEVTSIKIDVEGYEIGKNVADLKVTTKQPGVILKKVKLNRPHSGGSQTEVKDGVFKANIDYSLSIKIDFEDGYSGPQITKNDVTINGKNTDYLWNYCKYDNYMYDIDLTHYLGKLEDPNAPVLEGITVVNPPNKTVYNEGDDFDPTGMVVKANYSDGSSNTVTDYVIYDDTNMSGAQDSVLIVYNDGSGRVETTQDITVKATGYFTISFDANGGGGTQTDDGKEIDKYTKYTLPECSFTPPSIYQHFGSWKIGDNIKYPGDVFKVLKNITVKAIWANDVTNNIEFTDGVGEAYYGDTPITKAVNGWNVTVKADPVNAEGVPFRKWSANLSGIVFDNKESNITTFKMLNMPVKLTAIYAPAPVYSVSIPDIDMGTVKEGFKALGSQPVTIINTGNQDIYTDGNSVEFTDESGNNLRLGTNSVPTYIPGGGKNDSSWYIAVQRMGLSKGVYTGTVRFKDRYGNLTKPVTAKVKLTVEENKEDRKTGDINGDITINGQDLQRLYEHLNGSNVLSDETIGNVNGDSVTNGQDLQRLYEHLNGTNPFE